jgi:hypothetical protein
MPDVHVVPQGDEWCVEVGGDVRSTHSTQDEAIRKGCHLAKRERAELVIHGLRRKLRGKDSEASDPRDHPR